MECGDGPRARRNSEILANRTPWDSFLEHRAQLLGFQGPLRGVIELGQLTDRPLVLVNKSLSRAGNLVDRSGESLVGGDEFALRLFVPAKEK